MQKIKNVKYFEDLPLVDMLRTHDWYYHYSDDHRVWCRGEAQMITIKKKINEEYGGFNDEVLILWNKYAPKMYKQTV